IDEEAAKSAAIKAARNAQIVATVDERVDILLRALHGPEHPCSLEERAAARARILDAMAAELADQPIASRSNRPTVPHSASAAPTHVRAPGKSPSFLGRLSDALRTIGAGVAEYATRIPGVMYGALAPHGLRLGMAAVATIALVAVGWTGLWVHALWTVRS